MSQLRVVDRKGKVLCEFQEDLVSSTQTILELQKTIIKKSEFLTKKKFDVNRMRLTLGDAKGKAMADKRMVLNKFFTAEDLKSKDPVTLVFKDLGLQISWKLVFLIEYLGPMLITALFVVFQKQIYGSTFKYNLSQKIGLTMIFLHYMKRELETLFVHRFSNDTMPFFNVFKNSFHYWVLLGVGAMYFILHPNYTSPAWASDNIHKGFLAAFCVFEFMNFQCHLVLRNLRKPGSSERGVPTGWGFDQMSCANYFWESLCWLTFSVSTQCFGAYFFTLVSFAQMLDWALKKHKRYKKDFGDKYPRGRKAMIPFII